MYTNKSNKNETIKQKLYTDGNGEETVRELREESEAIEGVGGRANNVDVEAERLV